METNDAYRAVTNPDTPGADLAAIAHAHLELGGDIARHPNAYPALLDWLEHYGDEFTRETVAWRRGLNSQGIVPHLTSAPSIPVEVSMVHVESSTPIAGESGETILGIPPIDASEPQMVQVGPPPSYAVPDGPVEVTPGPSFIPVDVSVEADSPQLYTPVTTPIGPPVHSVAPTYHQPADAPSGGMTALGFFFPVVGIVLYLVWKDQTPLKAKSAGKGALAGVITMVGIYLLYFIFLAILIGSF